MKSFGSALLATILLSGCTGQITSSGAPAGSEGSVDPGAGSPGAPGAGEPSSSAPLSCSEQDLAAPTVTARIRRLSRLEIENTLGDLLGESVRSLASDLGADTFAIGYSTGDERSVSANYVEALKSVADRAAAEWQSAADAPGEDCWVDGASSNECVQGFITSFGARAWRRPLETPEIEELLAVYTAGRATSAETSESAMALAGLEYVVRALLQSSSFLFRTELGAPGAGSASVTLTPHELAAQLSYALTASPPDAELREHADTAALSKDELLAQGRRLLEAHPERFTRQAERFVREWLGIDLENPVWSKDLELYPDATDTFKAALDVEAGLFLQDWASGASLPALLTAPRGFVSSDTAFVYGVSVEGAASPIELDPSQRAGILTQPSFLGSLAHIDASSPVLRGLAVMRKLLCLEPPPVPDMVPPLPPADQSSVKTTRQRYEQHTSAAFCAGCHSAIDPLGFAFEHYDAIGRYRDDENGEPVDSSGAIVGSPSSDAPVADAIELSTLLAASPDVHACFVRQVYRFTVGRKETDAEACALGDATAVFAEQDQNMRELMLSLVTAPSAAERLAQPAEP